MSLLVTSCTMGHQPDRLLDKGPQYLRTRTNRGMFAHHRKSAVELLAASKSQFYKCPSISLDDAHHVTQERPSGILGQSDSGAWQEKTPSRSKSEFDISSLKSLISNESNDSDDVIISPRVHQKETHQLWKPHHPHRARLKREFPGEQQQRPKSLYTDTYNALPCHSRPGENHDSRLNPSDKPLAKDTTELSKSAKVISDDKDQIINTPTTPLINVLSDKNPETSNIKRPVPLPRKNKERPVPPPRKLSLKENVNKNSLITPSPPLDKPRKYSEGAINTSQQSDVGEDKNRKFSSVENLRKRFTSSNANVSNKDTTSSNQLDEKNGGKDNNDNICKRSGKEVTYQATPIFIAKPQSAEENGCFQAKPFVISTQGTNSFLTQDNQSKQTNCDNKNGNNSSAVECTKGRKWYSNASMSNKNYSNLIGNASSVDSNSGISSGTGDTINDLSPTMSSILTPGVIVEMSIESVDQVVCCDSEVNAIPAAVTTSVDSLGGEPSIGESREVNRNSVLSGKMDVSLHEGTLYPSHSPTHFNPSLPRSHSDISCRLEIEGHHSRDSSIVSNHSRLSRASAGADLEQFFNQMGLEKGVLEPLTRLRELQNSEVLASVSSLDSHDAASICSSFSDNDNSESQTLECSQHPTSVVERNARIIKWLCNVRKAKTQPLKSDVAISDPKRTTSTSNDENN